MVLKVIKFFPDGLIRKLRLISVFLISQPGKLTITIHILPNISKSKGNKTMKFGQLTEWKVKNIFFKIMQKLR